MRTDNNQKDFYDMQTENTSSDLLLKVKIAEADALRYKNYYQRKAFENATNLRESANLQRAIDEMKGSLLWKLTAPFRGIVRRMRKIKVLRCVYELPMSFKNKIKILLFKKKIVFPKIGKPFCYDNAFLEKQRNTSLEGAPKISVAVVLCNTPQRHLKEMIKSVTDQTYSSWELCLFDESDGKHTYVGELCKALSRKDSRIRYKTLENSGDGFGNIYGAIKMSSGDYVAVLDQSDKLHPSALFEMTGAALEGADFIYTDEAKFYKNEKRDIHDLHFKPDFSPDMLRSYNYLSRFFAFSREIYDSLGDFFKGLDANQDYDLILRLTEKAGKIKHIPKILYFKRAGFDLKSTDAESNCDSAREALRGHLDRLGLKGEAREIEGINAFRIRYEITGKPLVSVIIPNKDHVSDLKLCLESLYEKTTYENYEVIVVENNSVEESTFEFYKEAEEKYPRFKLLRWHEGFNYSKINNFGFEYASGEYVILLNNDIEILTPEWIEEMLMFTQRSDVGITGMMLYYPDNTVQHAGVIVGLGGVAGHSHKLYKRTEMGYFYRMAVAQNYSAVTAASMMVKSSVFREVGGLEESFAVAFNDVDFCMKVRRAGYNIVWTPFAEAYHYESKSRGVEDSLEKRMRFQGEIDNFKERWSKELEQGDPYYNPNLTEHREDFGLAQSDLE